MLQQRLSELTIGEQFFLSEDRGNVTTNYVGCLCSARPTICLNDDTIVYTRLDDELSNDKISSNSFDLSMFTTEQLLQELERRKKESLV